jgi:hypothetical protein
MDTLITQYNLEKVKKKLLKLEEEYDLPELQSILDDVDNILGEIDTEHLDDLKNDF